MSAPDEPAVRVSVWNPANGLTALRIVLVPVFWVLLMHGDGTSAPWRLAAFAVFAVAAITDRYDGELARRRGLVTDVGKIADPIADKALIGAALVGLSLLALVPWWVTVVILVREVGVTVLRLVVIRHGVMPAGRGGKTKTFLQSVAIGLYVLPVGGPVPVLAAVVMALALVVTVVTGVHYTVRAVRLRRTSERTVRRRAQRERDRATRERAARGDRTAP